MLCAAIAGMTTSPQFRESPETTNRQTPSFGGTKFDCFGDSFLINRLDNEPSFEMTIPRMRALNNNRNAVTIQNGLSPGFLYPCVWSGSAINVPLKSRFRPMAEPAFNPGKPRHTDLATWAAHSPVG